MQTQLTAETSPRPNRVSESINDDDILLTSKQTRDRVGGVTTMCIWRWMRDERVQFPNRSRSIATIIGSWAICAAGRLSAFRKRPPRKRHPGAGSTGADRFGKRHQHPPIPPAFRFFKLPVLTSRGSVMTVDAYRYSRQSDPDQNPAYRGWARRPLPIDDAAALDRLADAAFAAGRFHAADRLAWLAEAAR